MLRELGVDFRTTPVIEVRTKADALDERYSNPRISVSDATPGCCRSVHCIVLSVVLLSPMMMLLLILVSSCQEMLRDRRSADHVLVSAHTFEGLEELVRRVVGALTSTGGGQRRPRAGQAQWIDPRLARVPTSKRRK